MLNPLNEILLEKPIVKPSNLTDSKLPRAIQSKLAAALGKQVYDFSAFTSFAITDKERDGKPANFAIIPNQYFYYASEMYDFSIELYKYFEIFEMVRPFANSLVGSAAEIRSSIEKNSSISIFFESKSDVELFSKFLDKDDDTYRLGSKRLINDKGQARGSRDCFGSVILKDINLPDASSGIFGRLVYDLCASKAVYQELVEYCLPIKHSHKGLSEVLKDHSIRDFAFKVIDYLHKNHYSKLLADLSDSKASNSKKNLPHLSNLFLPSSDPIDRNELSSGQASTLRFFEKPIKVSSTFLYISTQWYGDERAGLSFGSLEQYVTQNFDNLSLSKKDGVFYLYSSATKVISEYLPKPFLLLAGISGTGKTRFIREQAKATGELDETYCLTSVRPDWHEPSDLLGYISRLNGAADYIMTDALQFIAKAWRGIADAGLNIEVQDQRLVVSGDSSQLQGIMPYWLCLDEMNLAPVEQYFADYLSVLETREWSWENEAFTYRCDALLTPATIEQVGDADQLRAGLGFASAGYDSLWPLICEHGLSIPFNLMVAGTVNMDETTHGFSRKVIDRALSFDFGEFFPNDLADFFEQSKIPKALSYPIYSSATLAQFQSVIADGDAQKTRTFFEAINAVLKGTAFELAFRAFNELCLSVICFSPEDNKALAAVFDDFLMCKVLPRIEGDEDKLQTANGDELLPALSLALETALSDIWDDERLDLLRQNKASNDDPVTVACRSKIKLERMQKQLDSGFTSFWP